MAGIRGKNTRPELLLRRGLHTLGFRFRLHDRHLPGAPDLVLPRWRAVVLVHGCFWHGHDCPLFRWPGTREEFWRTKIGRNRARDEEVETALDGAGWRVMKVWECSMKGRGKLGAERVVLLIADWLCSDQRHGEIRGMDHAGG